MKSEQSDYKYDFWGRQTVLDFVINIIWFFFDIQIMNDLWHMQAIQQVFI